MAVPRHSMAFELGRRIRDGCNILFAGDSHFNPEDGLRYPFGILKSFPGNMRGLCFMPVDAGRGANKIGWTTNAQGATEKDPDEASGFASVTTGVLLDSRWENPYNGDETGNTGLALHGLFKTAGNDYTDWSGYTNWLVNGEALTYRPIFYTHSAGPSTLDYRKAGTGHGANSSHIPGGAWPVVCFRARFPFVFHHRTRTLAW